MSGHSKFANIKHKKERNDAAKGKIFTKIGRELAVAVKEGGGPDPANNSRLRDVIAKAKANNMPNDNIDRSINKAQHHLFQFTFTHLTVGKSYPCLRHHSLHPTGGIINAAHPVMQIKHLTTAAQFTVDCLADHLAILFHYIGLDRLTMLGSFL